MDSIEKKVFKGVSWLAVFKTVSQAFSWTITIIIARILVPDDYGLMTMATVITGFAMMFSRMGLGSAIIQREKINSREVSTVFWFLIIISILFAIFCWFIAYPTAWIFNEPRVIPITRTVSVIFLISGLQIVPLNLLRRELAFKKIGFIELVGVFVSCVCMYIFAKNGFGVWTLIGGNIVNEGVKLLLLYPVSRWRPKLFFDFSIIKGYLSFGAIVALSESLFYVFSRCDSFFAGRVWPAETLGLYAFAKQLASLPTEKIVVLINQVSFSAFSRLQNDKKQFNNFYLMVVGLTATLTFPLFIGGYLVGKDLIYVLLDEKWYPMIFVFRLLCFVQILTAMNAVNNFVHTAQGRPLWAFYHNFVLAVIMSVSFFYATKYGFTAILFPWFSSYLLACLIWIFLTLRRLDIRIVQYGKVLWPAFCATLIMTMIIMGFDYFNSTISSVYLKLGFKVFLGGVVYASSIIIIDRTMLVKIKNFYKPQT